MLSRTIILALEVCAEKSAGYGRPIATETERQGSNGMRAAGVSRPAGFRIAFNAMLGNCRVFAGGASPCIRSAAIENIDPRRDADPIEGMNLFRTHPNGASFRATCIDAGTPGLWRVRCIGCHEVRSRRRGAGGGYAGSDGRWSREAVRERTAGDKMADGGLPDPANEDPQGSMTSNARCEYGAPSIKTDSRRVRRAGAGPRPVMVAAKHPAGIRNRSSNTATGMADSAKR